MGEIGVSIPTSENEFYGAGDRLRFGLLIALIIGVPTVFLRTTFSTFDVPQLVTLWVLAVGVVLVGLYRVIVSGVIERGPTSLTVTSTGFLGALVLTSVLSSQPWIAFTGLTVRGAGAITYGLCLALLHAAYRLGRRHSLEPALHPRTKRRLRIQTRMVMMATMRRMVMII